MAQSLVLLRNDSWNLVARTALGDGRELLTVEKPGAGKRCHVAWRSGSKAAVDICNRSCDAAE